ncbi:MAG: hypothetical protein J6D52_00170 [Clostridia bacterium]|nr:hypothetical protein [Clostridia bacterium]
MTISQKCNCCMHEEVCSKRNVYSDGCKNIAEAVKHLGCEFDIHIKCPHFAVRLQNKSNDDLFQNRGDNNA